VPVPSRANESSRVDPGVALAVSAAIGMSCTVASVVRPWKDSRAISSLASFTTALKSGTALSYFL